MNKNKKFLVEVSFKNMLNIEVKAKSEEEAKQKVLDRPDQYIDTHNLEINDVEIW